MDLGGINDIPYYFSKFPSHILKTLKWIYYIFMIKDVIHVCNADGNGPQNSWTPACHFTWIFDLAREIQKCLKVVPLAGRRWPSMVLTRILDSWMVVDVCWSRWSL